MVHRLKRLPVIWETWVRSLGREDPLENEMATHSSVLAWKIPWTERLGGLQSTGRSRIRLSDFTFTFINFDVQLFKVVSVILGFGHIFPKSFSDLGPVLLYWASLVAQW